MIIVALMLTGSVIALAQDSTQIAGKAVVRVGSSGIDSDNPDGKDGFSDNRAFNAGIRLLF